MQKRPPVASVAHTNGSCWHTWTDVGGNRGRIDGGEREQLFMAPVDGWLWHTWTNGDGEREQMIFRRDFERWD